MLDLNPFSRNYWINNDDDDDDDIKKDRIVVKIIEGLNTIKRNGKIC